MLVIMFFMIFLYLSFYSAHILNFNIFNANLVKKVLSSIILINYLYYETNPI